MGVIESTELIQFIGALIFLASIIVGSYWFVYAPTRREENQQRIKEDEERESGSPQR